MHETVFAKKIIDEAKKHGDVQSIVIEVGELANVPGRELLECLQMLTKWNVQMNEIRSVVKCECGFNGHPTILERGHDYFFIECPQCKDIPEIISGTDIKLVSVTVK